MAKNGQLPSDDAQVLRWPGKLLSADDLRRYLTSQRELVLLPRTIITPLAQDELRARGVRITWQIVQATEKQSTVGGWAYAQQHVDVAISSAVTALGREGIALHPLNPIVTQPASWSKAIASEIAQRHHEGVVAFCSDPGLICCVANKFSGLRAVAIMTAAQANRARQQLAANLLAVEMPGKTFFEVRQILRAVTLTAQCQPDVMQTLQELDGHAHR